MPFSRAWIGGSAKIGEINVSTDRIEVREFGAGKDYGFFHLAFVTVVFPRRFGARGVKKLEAHPEIAEVVREDTVTLKVGIKVDSDEPSVLYKCVDVIAGALYTTVESVGELPSLSQPRPL